MAKYQRKPEVVEAVHWDGSQISEVTPWIKEGLNKLWPEKGALMRVGTRVDIQGDMYATCANPGDYIVKEEGGNMQAVRSDIFEALYIKA